MLVCVEANEAVVKREHFKRRALALRDRPELVIDLSIPRAVEPEVAELDNVLLYDLDDLKPVIESNLKTRSEASHSSSEILVAEMHKFLSLQTYAAFSPAIAALRDQFDDIREAIRLLAGHLEEA